MTHLSKTERTSGDEITSAMWARQSAIQSNSRRSTSLSFRDVADAAHAMSSNVQPASRALAASILLPFHPDLPPSNLVTRSKLSRQGESAFSSS
jgi:hypothetical protein